MHPYANPILYVPVEFPDQEQDGDDLFKQAVLSTETDVALQEEIETLSKRTDHQSAQVTQTSETMAASHRPSGETIWPSICLQRHVLNFTAALRSRLGMACGGSMWRRLKRYARKRRMAPPLERCSQ